MFLLTHPRIKQAKDSQKWLQKCLEYVVNPSGELTGKRYKEFWRTLICDLTSYNLPAPAEYGLYLKKYLDFLKSEVLEVILPPRKIN
jgi:hypothetical protein